MYRRRRRRLDPRVFIMLGYPVHLIKWFIIAALLLMPVVAFLHVLGIPV
jgi:hypothetical protein